MNPKNDFHCNSETHRHNQTTAHRWTTYVKSKSAKRCCIDTLLPILIVMIRALLSSAAVAVVFLFVNFQIAVNGNFAAAVFAVYRVRVRVQG